MPTPRSCATSTADRSRAWRHLAFLIGHWHLGGIGSWALEEKEGGALLGLAGFAEPEGWPGCELAWTLARRHWGHGFATEGACAALDYAFTVLGREQVISLIHPENRASIRVAERLELAPDGSHPMLSGEFLVYGVTRSRWTEGRRVEAPAQAGGEKLLRRSA